MGRNVARITHSCVHTSIGLPLCTRMRRPALEQHAFEARKRRSVRHVQAWCEAGVGAMPMDTDTDTDVGDWLAETSESQSHAVPTPMRQVSFIGLDTVQEASSEGTPTSAPTQQGAVSPVHLKVGVMLSTSDGVSMDMVRRLAFATVHPAQKTSPRLLWHVRCCVLCMS